MGTAPKAGLSELTEHPALKGIAVGACVCGDAWDGDPTAKLAEKAHAHLSGARSGWICIRKLRHYNATTIRHEIAHLVRENARHDEAWRREVRALGGEVERAYRKR